MTTNVTDMLAGVMACDSRWSIKKTAKFIVFVDDTGFDKICMHGRFAFMFAGDGLGIQIWKEWLATSPATFTRLPSPRGVAVCIVDMNGQELLYHRGQDIRRPNDTAPVALFAGSGAMHAVDCWETNRDAMRAVNSAMAFDPFTGGSVKYVRFVDRCTNIRDAASIADVGQQLAARGTVMFHNQNSFVPIAEAAAKDPEVRALVEQIKTGAVVAQAPCDSMYNEWTEEEVAGLKAALAKVFNIKE